MSNNHFYDSIIVKENISTAHEIKKYEISMISL